VTTSKRLFPISPGALLVGGAREYSWSDIFGTLGVQRLI
jgi:hypothetical protein